MPINPDIPVDGETNWDVKLNDALDILVGASNDQETDIAGKADISHTHDAAAITTGVLTPARLGSGSPSSSNYLRGDGTWTTVDSGGTTLSMAGWWTTLPTPAWVIVGEPMQSDGGWSTSRNGELTLSPIDVPATKNITSLGISVLSAPSVGNTFVGIWGSGSDGRPTSTPIWTGSFTILGVGSGTQNVTVSPAVSVGPTVRRWVGIMNLNWSGAGEIRRGVVPSQPVGWMGHWGNDANAAGLALGQNFPQTVIRSGATTISTDLTSATYTATASRPWLTVKLETP